jgi:uncharacterized protein (DUF2237 family)
MHSLLFSTHLCKMNIFKKPLKTCSTNPMTGYKRDGTCGYDDGDEGTHVVCAQVDDRFLQYTKSKGNDLITPRGSSFPGLKSGDHWCLCANRWMQAFRGGMAPKVDLEATSVQALKYIPIKTLQKYRK